MPVVAVSTASKTAIDGFTASLALELEDFNVRVKLVEPGYGPTTNFTTNGTRSSEMSARSAALSPGASEE
jgi:NAD(P)-dependent dehydrogenase (short-subunit alcohol dehydrogenase family)